jgi:hypothetical protein
MGPPVGTDTTSGKAFRAYINVGVTPVAIVGRVRGEIVNSTDELDGTDSDSSPYQVTDSGTYGCKITLEGNFRLDSGVVSALQAGTRLTNLQIYPHGVNAASPYIPTVDDAESWRFPSAEVLECSQPTEIRGKVTATFRVASRGVFYVPGEETP